MITTNIKSTFKSIFITAPAILCWCLFSLAGCKEPIIEDTDLLTDDDNLSLAKDTLYTQVFSEFEQPLAANGIGAGVLGSVGDANFGKSYLGFYAQARLSQNNVNFGTNPELDSVVLTLDPLTTYGPFTKPVNLAVYELNEDMIDSFKYKTNYAFNVKVPAIGQLQNFKPNLVDSIREYGVTLKPHIRIPLSASFGNKILLADTANLASNPVFLQLLKGLFVTTTSAVDGDGLVYVGIRSNLTKITLYYKNTTADSLVYNIPFSGVTVNHFDNSYSGAPVYTSVTTPNPNGETKMYVQGGSGVKGKILIKDLDSLPKNIAINKAEVVLSQSNESIADTAYLPPLVLDLYRIDATGVAQFLDDDGSSQFGGVRFTETVNGTPVTRYRFNIKKYFQKLIQGVYPNKGFYLQVLGASSNTERVVFANSSTDEKYKVTLIVTYTKL